MQTARTTTTRRTIRPGIYADAHGITAILRGAGGKLVWSARYALDYDVDAIEADRLTARATYLQTKPTRGNAATLGGAFADLIADLPPTVAKRADFIHIGRHWEKTDLWRERLDAITPTAIRTELRRWEHQGVPVSTSNHRLRVARAVFHHAWGIDRPNPTDKVHGRRPDDPEPRAIPLALVERLIANMPDRGRADRFGKRPAVSQTKTRLAVMLWTGVPHKTLERLEPGSFSPTLATLTLPPRKKGKGAKSVTIDLIPQAVAALQAFDAAELWGKPFSRSSMRKSWASTLQRTAALAAKAKDRPLLELLRALPKNCRPYDIRHSFLTAAYRASNGDLKAVQTLGQHADSKTTERYVAAAVPERVARAVAALAAQFPTTPPPAATPPAAESRVVKMHARRGRRA